MNGASQSLRAPRAKRGWLHGEMPVVNDTPVSSSSDPIPHAILPPPLALPPPPRSLLVAPCGNGILCQKLSVLGLRVTGIDRDERVIASARERAAEAGRPVTLQVADTGRMSFADRHFDAVLCIDFIEW